MPTLRKEDILRKSKHACRELFWDSGLFVVTIAASEMQEAFLPGAVRGEPTPALIFKEKVPPICLSSGRGKFLLRQYGPPSSWVDKPLGVYVDKAMKTRNGPGSIQFAIGPDFWTEGNYSGRNAPPPLSPKSKPWPENGSAVPPEPVASDPELPPEVTTETTDDEPPEAIEGAEGEQENAV